MSATEAEAFCLPRRRAPESHPSPETLLRFAEGFSRRTEAREVVRHLLRGCRACSALVSGQISIQFDEDIYEPIFRRVLQKTEEVAR